MPTIPLLGSAPVDTQPAQELPHIPLVSLPALMTTTPTPQATPMILSPSFPPVPDKLVAKIKSGTFVHLKELLGDNIALRQRLEETPPTHMAPWPTTLPLPQMRNISTPLQWVYCMLIYMAVRCPDNQTRDMLTYTRLVLHLAQKHGGSGWLDYDKTFRLQAASNPSLRWNVINPSLMASAVLSAFSSGTFCPHCQEVDHKPGDCALASLDFQARQKLSAPTPLRQRSQRPNPYDASVEVCRRFNRGVCNDNVNCKFRHICNIPECKRVGHGAYCCPLRSTEILPTLAPSKPRGTQSAD